ncbi:hypothetical protein M011DRAFT_453241 [Sporormia fimetaria CBS 119925]|uniref:UBX domain-containing protein n=1 Tax=Sporormia fimetaria CBS 119925 TaxID=1340428 RepID=A0A6A6UXF3_9PLEO|nr:hypothetical protein M011DRAFT_453241 [Sporormia fimetaria CBS 119925]
MPSDLEQLLDMGFDKEKAELAVKQAGNLHGAIEWLDKNQDKTIEQIREEQQAGASEEQEPPMKPGEEAKSLVCDDCGKKFKSMTAAEFHAEKSGHENFSESTEEIKPLTEEEKKAKLEELRAKAAARKAEQADQEKIERKKNEQIRMKNTKESQAAKEELQKKERLKEAMQKKREKVEEAEAKKRVLAKLEADKQERKRKAEMEKAARAGQPLPVEPEAPKPAAPKAASAYTESRLALQTPNGRVIKTFPVETTLFEVVQALQAEGHAVSSFTQNFPKKTFDQADFGMTLKEAGLVPSAALIVK